MSETAEAAVPQAATMNGLAPYLHPSDAPGAIDFYKKAFAAKEIARMPADDGKRLMHAHLEINGSPVLLSSCFPEHGFPAKTPQGFHLHLQVEDGQAWWDRAVAAGAAVAMPFAKQFWGDIYGELDDPFGYRWSIGSSPKA